MKKSELQQIIREEIKNILNEASDDGKFMANIRKKERRAANKFRVSPENVTTKPDFWLKDKSKLSIAVKELEKKMKGQQNNLEKYLIRPFNADDFEKSVNRFIWRKQNPNIIYKKLN